MLKIYFSKWRDGRVLRLPFLGYSLLLTALLFGYIFAVVFSIGAAEHLIGGDLQQTQALLRQAFTLPFTMISILLLVLYLAAAMNLMAKRIRDTGLPGWWGVLVVVLLTGSVSITVSGGTGNGLHTLIWIFLLLVPSDLFTKHYH